MRIGKVQGCSILVNEAMEPFGVANGRTERFVITGKNIRLPPNVTLALGIAFHELATNAVKYGAFSNEAGSILIAWTIEPAPAGRPAHPALAGEGRPARHTTDPERIRLAGD